MSWDNAKTIAVWLGVTVFYAAMILLAGLLAGLFSGCVMLVGTPLENAVHAVQVQHGNCYAKAMEIGAVRADYGANTGIVIAYGTRCLSESESNVMGVYMWHAFWRDENGDLRDVTSQGTVLATPMFEFDYVKGMQTTIQDNAILIVLNQKSYIAFRCYEDGRFEILLGNEHVRILGKGE